MSEDNLQKNIEKNFGVPGTADSQSSRLKTLRTFQGDIDEALVKTKASVISIAVAEQKRTIDKEEKDKGASANTHASGNPEAFKNTNTTVLEKRREPTDAKNKLFVYLGSILFVLAIIIIATVYFFSKNQTNAPQTINQTNTILNYTKESDIDISDSNTQTLSYNIFQEKKKFNLQINSILYLNLKKDGVTASVTNAISTLTPNIPSELLRNLGEKYMIGIYSFDTNEPFIILTTNDYGLGYAGMLTWEKTMTNDLGQVFNLSLSSSLPSFSDEALRNKDLRIIKDDNGKTVLLYSFIDKNTILITSNEKIFNALLAKYITSEMVR